MPVATSSTPIPGRNRGRIGSGQSGWLKLLGHQRVVTQSRGRQRSAHRNAFITATSEGPKHLEVKLTRAPFNGLTTDLAERLKGPLPPTDPQHRDAATVPVPTAVEEEPNTRQAPRRLAADAASKVEPPESRPKPRPIRKTRKSMSYWEKQTALDEQYHSGKLRVHA